MKYRNSRRRRRMLATVALVVAGAAAAASSPRAVVESLQEGLVAVANASATSNIEERFARLEPLIVRTHDLPYIAQFAVGRYWRDWSADEQARFVTRFERLSVMSYAARFVRIDSSTFELGDVNELGNGRVEVRSSIHRADGSLVPIDYVLMPRGDDWKIINIVADGVSDLALKRAEYQQVLSGGSFADLSSICGADRGPGKPGAALADEAVVLDALVAEARGRACADRLDHEAFLGRV